MRVEEKLDGANVMLWADDGRIDVAPRGGPGARDRAGQLGPLRAWVAKRWDRLEPLLADETVMYAEWLWLVHGTSYGELPSHLIALDLWREGAGFLTVADRDAKLATAGVPPPPVIFEGTLRSLDTLETLIGASTFGHAPSEGVVVRRLGSQVEPRIAKCVAAGYQRPTDAHFAGERRLNPLHPTGS